MLGMIMRFVASSWSSPSSGRRMEHVVSVQPRPWPKPSGVIVAAVRAKYARRQAPLAVQVRDRLGELFPDVEFESAFGDRGRPGWSPGRLALVTVLQMAEDLTDRQAAEAVRERLSWQYALGLELDDPGFDHTVLSEFRSRVVEHGLEERVLDLLLARLAEEGAWWAREASSAPTRRTWSPRSGIATGWSWPGSRCAPAWRRWPWLRRGGWPG